LTATARAVPWRHTAPLKGGEDYVSLFSNSIPVIERLRSDDDGQGLAEYALILALIAIVAIVALIFLGTQVSERLSQVGTAI
jgi:pilus assembly protein Flp/PilA